ncbi:MAG: low-specificity L-threonine aldolase [Chloroflexi bacterium]|nr:low-specificity L-threonine aldolase [Chloroflexota bacterium]
MPKLVDLRSDTVTQPTAAMREAMAVAEVGDDVYGEDPTINRLEKLAATRMGMPSSMFVPSGTMGNLAAILAHCARGDEMILGHLSHSFLFEAGGAAALGGVQPRTVRNQEDGTLDFEDIRASIRENDPHFPITRLICLENTHNRCGGNPITATYTKAVGDIAKEYDLKLHIDGARIFNAAAAQNVPARDLVQNADSVTFCLSKALCAPVGSLLCGSEAFIHKARRVRKQLGGGMRQAGVLAAAGIIALEKMTSRLVDDHARARRLAAGLVRMDEEEFSVSTPTTNMVYVTIRPEASFDAKVLAAVLKSKGIRVGIVASHRIRLVLHHDIDDDSLQIAITAIKQSWSELRN